MNDENLDLGESIESNEKVEQLTLVIQRYGWARKKPWRYIPLNFHSIFVLFSIEDDPRSVKEAIN